MAVIYTLMGIAYTPVIDPVRGIVLRKAARKRVPSPGQMSLFSSNEPKQGDTKVENGVTYQLNQHSRWERTDKAKGQSKPKAVVPVMEEKVPAKAEAMPVEAVVNKLENLDLPKARQQAKSQTIIGYKNLIERAQQKFAKEIEILETINDREHRLRVNALKTKIASKDNLLNKEIEKDRNDDPSYSLSREIQLQNEVNELTRKLKEIDYVPKIFAMESIREKLISKKNDTKTLSMLSEINIQPGLPAESDVNYKEVLQELISATGGRVTQLKQVVYNADRAHVTKNKINTGKASDGDIGGQVRSFWHEYGHLLEDTDLALKDAAVEWILSRSNGSPITQLKELTHGDYEDAEAAWPGRFISPYVGKYIGSYSFDFDGKYEPITNEGKPLQDHLKVSGKDVSHTEVYSMGLEHFTGAYDMMTFYGRDKEHFLLTLGALS